MAEYSTRQAAEKLGLSMSTLNLYIAEMKVPTPPLRRVGGVRVRLWNDKVIDNVRKILPKIANGRKTKHKKKASKTRKKK